MTREEKILKGVDKSARGVEIGPSHNPIASKRNGYRVVTIDTLPKEGLLEKYKNHGVKLENIEEVDFVWRGERYPALVGERNAFSWIDHRIPCYRTYPGHRRFSRGLRGAAFRHRGSLLGRAGQAVLLRPFSADFGACTNIGLPLLGVHPTHAWQRGRVYAECGVKSWSDRVVASPPRRFCVLVRTGLGPSSSKAGARSSDKYRCARMVFYPGVIPFAHPRPQSFGSHDLAAGLFFFDRRERIFHCAEQDAKGGLRRSPHSAAGSLSRGRCELNATFQ